MNQQIRSVVDECPRLRLQVNKGERHRIMHEGITRGSLWVEPRDNFFAVKLSGQEIEKVMYDFMRRRFGVEDRAPPERPKVWNIGDVEDIAEIIRFFGDATVEPRESTLSPETGEVAVDLIHGEKLYQQRARAALPILVRQAWAGETMYYSDLAAELGISNPRVLNYPLGSIGNTLIQLAEEMGHEVPPIQALVVAKGTGLPGEGLSWFVPDAEHFKSATRQERKRIVDAMLQHVYTYPHWAEVLAQLGLERPSQGPLPPIEDLRHFGGGEGQEHRALKLRVAEHPNLVGLSPSVGPGAVEVLQYSGDSVDVFFTDSRSWIAVEVKGESAPVSEVVRGLFQCVKYEAVLEAQAKCEGVRVSCEALLALGGEFPQELVSLRNTLQVRVFEGLGQA